MINRRDNTIWKINQLWLNQLYGFDDAVLRLDSTIYAGFPADKWYLLMKEVLAMYDFLTTQKNEQFIAKKTQSSGDKKNSVGNSVPLSPTARFSENEIRYVPKVALKNNIIQKTPISEEEAWERMEERVPDMVEGTEIVEPWDDEWGESNCHGYLIYKEPGHAVDSETALKHISQNMLDENISLFFVGEELAHSGIYLDGEITHLLKDIGILKTKSDDNRTLGYDKRFNLPKDKVQFEEYYKKFDEENDMYERVQHIIETCGEQWESFFAEKGMEVNKGFDIIAYDYREYLSDPSGADEKKFTDAQKLFIEMEEYAKQNGFIKI